MAVVSSPPAAPAPRQAGAANAALPPAPGGFGSSGRLVCRVDAQGGQGRIGGARVPVHAAMSPAHPLLLRAGSRVVAESRIWLLSQDEQNRVLTCDSSPRCGCSSASPCLPPQTLHTKAAENAPWLHKHPVRGVETQLQHGLGVLLVVLMLCHPAREIAAPLLELPGLLPPVKTTAGIFPKILQA